MSGEASIKRDTTAESPSSTEVKGEGSIKKIDEVVVKRDESIEDAVMDEVVVKREESIKKEDDEMDEGNVKRDESVKNEDSEMEEIAVEEKPERPSTPPLPAGVDNDKGSKDDENAVDSVPDESTTTTATNGEDRPWDFTKRKVVVQGIRKFLSNKEATRLLDKWLEDLNSKTTDTASAKVAYDKLRKPPKKTFMMVTFQSEDMVQPFIDYINTSNIRGNQGQPIRAKPATVEKVDIDKASGRKRSADDIEQQQPLSKRQRNALDRTDVEATRRPISVEELKDKIIPLWRLSKDEQLDKKMKEMINKGAQKIIKEVKAKFRTLNRDKNRKDKEELYPWIKQPRPLNVERILSAPTPLRNKSEFNFGHRYLFDRKTIPSSAKEEEKDDNDSSRITKEENNNEANNAGEEKGTVTGVETRKIPSVGFHVTGWSGGVAYEATLEHIPSEVHVLVKMINEFLLTSPLPPYDSKTHCGFWRVLTVRTSKRTNECMLIIQHAPPASGGRGEIDEPYDYSKEFETERPRLIKTLTDLELPAGDDGESSLKVTSIFFQEFGGLSNPPPEHPVQHAYGKTCLTEELCGCIFEISPGAFFQVNTEGAEILYKLAVDKVKEVASDPDKTLLFDVCCGTGTIGLTCLKEGAVGKVVGVDISEPAIRDAKRNAELNGFGQSNVGGKTHFVAAKAEHVLANEIRRTKDSNMKFVAIVDPARDGLHPDVVKTLRSNEQIERLVYVSCNPTGTLVRDAALLCAPPTKKYRGRAFKISLMQPVDMFPFTDHCEMVVTFDRL